MTGHDDPAERRFSVKGPFYVKDGDGFVLTDICRECAFCSESDGTCILSECFMQIGVENEEEEKEK